MNMSDIGALDAIIGVALAWALFRGFQKGFIVKIASLIALVAGTFAGFHGSEGLANWLTNEVNWSETSVQLTAFILTFILVVIGVHFLAKLIEKMVDLTALGLINKLAGMALGAFQMVLLLSITTFALDGVFGERNWLPDRSRRGIRPLSVRGNSRGMDHSRNEPIHALGPNSRSHAR
jgi:membrane protein required for colicin V production